MAAHDDPTTGPGPGTTVPCPRCSDPAGVPEGAAVAHACGAVFGLRAMGTCSTQEARVTKRPWPSRRTFVDHAVHSRDGGAHRWSYVTAGAPFEIRPGDEWAVLFGMAEAVRGGFWWDRVELRPHLVRLVNLTLGGAGQEIVPAAAVPSAWTAEAVDLVDRALPRLDTRGPASGATTREIRKAGRRGRRR